MPVAVPSAAAEAEPVPAFPVRSPAPPGVPDARGLQRALRPLRRRVPSPRRRVLDEAATARFIAGTGVWAPVLAPAAERRFEAVLAVDTSPSMAVWRQMEADLARLLSRSGAFRDVRLCRLDGSAESVVLRTGRSGALLRPAQLIDGSRRRVFLLLSDAVGARWHDGSAARELAGWARTGPMAVLQPLPEQLWARTGLPGRAARITVTGSGAANAAWAVRYRRAAPGAGVPVPVLGLAPAAWRSWTRVVAGRVSDVPLAIAALGPAPSTGAAWDDDVSGDPVDLFRATASPAAYELAVCLSVVPLTLDTMRLVQHVVVGAPPSALAEVLLGGLLLRTGEESFDFVESARERLLGELRRSEAARVLRVMSAYLADHAGTAGPSFPALAPDPDGYLQISAATFAWLPAVAAERLGLRQQQPMERVAPAVAEERRPAPAAPAPARRVILIGPPQPDARLVAPDLAERLGVPTLDFGLYLRAEVTRRTQLGMLARNHVVHARLVPDDIATRGIRDLFALAAGAAEGFVLTSYPRTVEQASDLDRLLAAGGASVDLVLAMKLDDGQGYDWMSGRRACPDCGSVWHTGFDPPQRDGVCDMCGALLAHRDADQPRVVTDRMRQWDREAAGVLEFYRAQGKVVDFHAVGSRRDVTARALAALDPRPSAPAAASPTQREIQSITDPQARMRLLRTAASGSDLVFFIETDPAPEVLREAIRLLAAAVPGQTADLVSAVSRRLREEPDHETRRVLLAMLHETCADQPRTTATLMNSALHDPDLGVRRGVLRMLGSPHGDASRAVLEQSIARDETATMRLTAIETLAEDGHPEATAILARAAFQDGRSAVRVAALRSLRARPLDDGIRAGLLHAARSDRSNTVRAIAMEVLASHWGADDEVVELLEVEGERTRVPELFRTAATVALSIPGQEARTWPLVSFRLRQDLDPGIRAVAATLFARARDWDAAPELLANTILGDPDPNVVTAAGRALLELDPASGRDLLAQQLTAPIGVRRRSTIIGVLAEVMATDEPVRGAVIACTRDADTVIRLAAVEALTALAHLPEVRAALAECAEDPDADVSRRARRLLQDTGNGSPVSAADMHREVAVGVTVHRRLDPDSYDAVRSELVRFLWSYPRVHVVVAHPGAAQETVLDAVRQSHGTYEIAGSDDDFEAQRLAAVEVVERCDVLVAVWNGDEDEDGYFGPSRTVELARERGKPVTVVWQS